MKINGTKRRNKEISKSFSLNIYIIINFLGYNSFNYFVKENFSVFDVLYEKNTLQCYNTVNFIGTLSYIFHNIIDISISQGFILIFILLFKFC